MRSLLLLLLFLLLLLIMMYYSHGLMENQQRSKFNVWNPTSDTRRGEEAFRSVRSKVKERSFSGSQLLQLLLKPEGPPPPAPPSSSSCSPPPPALLLLLLQAPQSRRSRRRRVAACEDAKVSSLSW